MKDIEWWARQEGFGMLIYLFFSPKIMISENRSNKSEVNELTTCKRGTNKVEKDNDVRKHFKLKLLFLGLLEGYLTKSMIIENTLFNPSCFIIFMLSVFSWVK